MISYKSKKKVRQDNFCPRQNFPIFPLHKTGKFDILLLERNDTLSNSVVFIIIRRGSLKWERRAFSYAQNLVSVKKTKTIVFYRKQSEHIQKRLNKFEHVEI